MYSFTLPAHQKIDRVAFRHLTDLLGGKAPFPTIEEIIHFEGKHGPDAAKLKKGTTSPWHFYDPYREDNNHEFWALIEAHYKRLAKELKANNLERASFEASWLAHGLVDGLTPAHHYPYEQKLEHLRGEDKDSRQTVSSRVMVKGESPRESLRKSLQLLGPKGLLTTHTMFEAGAATIILPLRLTQGLPEPEEIKQFNKIGLVAFFKRQAREVADLQMYERYYKRGWHPGLARDIRKELAPTMVRMVCLAWYGALVDSGLIKPLYPANSV